MNLNKNPQSSYNIIIQYEEDRINLLDFIYWYRYILIIYLD